MSLSHVIEYVRAQRAPSWNILPMFHQIPLEEQWSLNDLYDTLMEAHMDGVSYSDNDELLVEVLDQYMGTRQLPMYA